MILLYKTIHFMIYIVDNALYLYNFVVLISCIISWVNADPYNPFVRILRNLTEPVFWRIRKWMPFTYTSGIDFSPIVVFIAISFIRTVLLDTLRSSI